MTDYIGQQFGNYRLLHLLGEGGFAAVYLGEHRYLERPAAIKVLHLHMDQTSHEVFLREARTIARLDHPHIVRVLDYGIEGQIPYLVMEYIPNDTLRKRYPKGTRLSFEQIVSYVKQIASALDYAHEQHVIHRDIKPENILLNAKEEIVLSDFGIAVVQRTLDTLSTQNMAGTPLYMAPEQIMHHPCPASDQYALAVMVYEWLCGQPPFPGPGAAIYGQHLYQDPPSLCAKLPQLPLAVEDTVFGALAKDPTQRFESVQDFATVLEEACFATQLLEVLEPNEIMVSGPLATPSDTLPIPIASPSRAASLSQPPEQATLPSAKKHQVPLVVSIYAPADQTLLEKWEAHLSPLKQAGLLQVWSEHHLLAGTSRLQQVNAQLDRADLTVLLVSADFFDDQDCMAHMQHAMHLQQQGKGRVVPLLLRPVEWDSTALGPLPCMPSNRLPVTQWTNQDAAFDKCVQDLCHFLGMATPADRKNKQPPHLPRQHQNRERLLRRVRSFWIEDVLENSLHGAVLLTLGLQMQPDAVTNPWNLVLQQSYTTPRPLPARTHITQVYDNVDGELLILGAPGAGKTTLLLELARDLLKRAEQDEQKPLPVIFNLSSWAIKQQSLEAWLAEELNTKYDVPPRLAHNLIEADLILPLLDGLDEVAVQARTACIEAINAYRGRHGMLPLVVCSRSADYLAQSARIHLRNAVQIQPLSSPQINAYLHDVGKSVEALHIAIQHDPDLQALATTPLMLSILTLAYQGTPPREIAPLGSLPAKQQQVFATYVERMLKRRGPLKAGKKQQIVQWLAFLARQMRAHNQTVFYLEHLQPDWLETRQRRVYNWLGVHIPNIIIGILASLMVFLFLNGFTGSPQPDPTALLQIGTLGGLLGWFFSQISNTAALSLPQPGRATTRKRTFLTYTLLSAVIGLTYGITSSIGQGLTFSDGRLGSSILGGMMGLGWWILLALQPLFTRMTIPTTVNRKPRLRYVVVLVALVLGLSIGLGSGPSTWLTSGKVSGLGSQLISGPTIYPIDNWQQVGLMTGLSDWPIWSLNFGLTSVLIGLIVGIQTDAIRLTERMHWTWSSLKKSLFTPKHLRATLLLICLITTLFGLSVYLNLRLDSDTLINLINAPGLGLSSGLTYWLLLGLFQGVTQEQIEDQHRHMFNQGVRHSLRNSIIMGIISTGLIGIISTLNLGLTQGTIYELSNMAIDAPNLGINDWLTNSLDNMHTYLSLGLWIGIVSGCFIWLQSGGLTVLRHALLRLLLALLHVFPWHAQFFLNEATDYLHLQRVGGGYAFIHRLLLEYFADLHM